MDEMLPDQIRVIRDSVIRFTPLSLPDCIGQGDHFTKSKINSSRGYSNSI
jgi:hypothetical protein